MTDQASQDLLDALAYIKEHGRCRVVLEDNRGRVCPLGAIGHVTVPNFEQYANNEAYVQLEASERSMAAIRKLAEHVRPNFVYEATDPHKAVRVVFRWNDNRVDWDTVQDDVIFTGMEEAARA